MDAFTENLKGIKKNAFALLLKCPEYLESKNKYKFVHHYWELFSNRGTGDFELSFREGGVKSESWLVARRWVIDSVPDWHKYKDKKNHERFKKFHIEENWKNPAQITINLGEK
jgi:hypothetical protein